MPSDFHRKVLIEKITRKLEQDSRRVDTRLLEKIFEMINNV